jgi:outer membrane murein-binding lipoprotein Lpp
MKLTRIFLPIAVVAFGFFITTTPVSGTMEMAKKEKTACKTCHVNAKVTKESKDLSKVGECYKKTPDLAKCKS